MVGQFQTYERDKIKNFFHDLHKIWQPYGATILTFVQAEKPLNISN